MSARTTSLYLAGAAFIVVGIAVMTSRVPVAQYVGALAECVRASGVWGPAVLATTYVLTTLLFIPVWPLTILAGFLFGPVMGTVTASVGGVTGAAAAFALGRGVAHERVQRQLACSGRFQAIDDAVRREGLKIVLLIRLSPIFPYVFTNYAFSLTKIRFRDFFLASWIGMLPGTILYVYLGTSAESIAQIASGSYRRGPVQTVLFVLGLAGTVVVTTLVTRTVRSALRSEPPADSSRGEW